MAASDAGRATLPPRASSTHLTDVPRFLHKHGTNRRNPLLDLCDAGTGVCSVARKPGVHNISATLGIAPLTGALPVPETHAKRHKPARAEPGGTANHSTLPMLQRATARERKQRTLLARNALPSRFCATTDCTVDVISSSMEEKLITLWAMLASPARAACAPLSRVCAVETRFVPTFICI